MEEMTLTEITIPDEFVELCSGWAGDTGCMLRAIDSMGDLTLGSRCPLNDDGEPMTDHEWHHSLWSNLSCDVGHCRAMAEKSGHEDAQALREFEDFADEVCERLATDYGLDA